MKLLTPTPIQTTLRKTQNSQTEYAVWNLALSPADYAATGTSNCPNSNSACESACAGGPNFGLALLWTSIMDARAKKTRFLQSDRREFIAQLVSELNVAQDMADYKHHVLAVHLNAYSDIPWEHASYGQIPQRFPRAIFHDFTRMYARVGNTPSNYNLCASWSARPEDQARCLELLRNGHNVAVVFADVSGDFSGARGVSQNLPKQWMLAGRMYDVYDGDDVAERAGFLDPSETVARYGRLCGLRLKAGSNRQKVIESGFCVAIGQ